MTFRHRVPDRSTNDSPTWVEFTNVTALSWPDAVLPARFAEEIDHRKLRAALWDFMGMMSYAELASLSRSADALLSSRTAGG